MVLDIHHDVEVRHSRDGWQVDACGALRFRHGVWGFLLGTRIPPERVAVGERTWEETSSFTLSLETTDRTDKGIDVFGFLPSSLEGWTLW